MYIKHLIHARQFSRMVSFYEIFYVFFWLLHGEQDYQKFLEDSWCKINYIVPTEQWQTWENAVIKLKTC